MDWLSDWAGGIIIAVIIGTVIEMILPEGNSKKYIKMVIGIYVLFTIISPIITKVIGENIQVSNILDLDTYVKEAEESAQVQNTINNNNQESIMAIYISGLESDIKAKVEEKGFKVNNIDVGILDDESYKIEYINLKVEATIPIESNGVESNGNNDSNKNVVKSNKEIIEKVDEIKKVEISSNKKKEEQNSKTTEKSNEEVLSYLEKQEIKDYLSSVYEVKANNITIN